MGKVDDVGEVEEVRDVEKGKRQKDEMTHREEWGARSDQLQPSRPGCSAHAAGDCPRPAGLRMECCALHARVRLGGERRRDRVERLGRHPPEGGEARGGGQCYRRWSFGGGGCAHARRPNRSAPTQPRARWAAHRVLSSR